MSKLKNAEAWLRTQRKAHTVETITYTRGASSNADVEASRGQSDYEADDGEAIVKSTMTDWIIDKADLTLSDAAITPQAGDKITDADGNVFRVAQMGGEPEYIEHGTDGLTYRIHSVQVT